MGGTGVGEGTPVLFWLSETLDDLADGNNR